MSVPDEMVDGRNGVRPHWRGLLGALSALGWKEIAARRQRLLQAVEEEGAAGQLPHAGGPAWSCDPVPLLLSGAEFSDLAKGLVQRAALLEAVLADLYGPQRMLAEGLLPPALVFGNPAFLRPLRPRPFGAGRFLHAYAADLMRTADGTWRVVSDRTIGAPGAGYARESRNLLARFVPEMFRAVSIRQVRPFFEAWAASLQALAVPTAAGAPTGCAILTPGVGSPHWFEHMVLSRELSCPLVEGRDLTVRGGSLYLKTLAGLQPLGALLRKLDGRMLDPLELEGGSALGVTGLLSAVRDGRVRVLNDPGAGAVEMPALAAFLPTLCRHALGESLLLPTLPTLWLGEEASRARVRQNPGRWHIRPALDQVAAPVPIGGLDAEQHGAILDQLQARPGDWAAMAELAPSVAPFAGADGLVPAPVLLRMFLVHDGAAWQVMEGGLAWSLQTPDLHARMFPSGTVFKDVWVLRDDVETLPAPVPAARAPIPTRRAAGDLPSRVADDFFWFGRYIERLEGGARLAATALIRQARGAPLPRDVVEGVVLRRALIENGVIDAGAPILPALSASLSRGALSGYLDQVARLADALRDRLTGEMHLAVTHALHGTRSEAAVQDTPSSLGAAMTAILHLSNAVAGLAAENMVRGGGWLFLDLGRRIERAVATASQLACVLDQPVSRMESGSHLALELCDSVITYRHRYPSVVQPGPALDLVLADPDNPRALVFQFSRAAHALEHVGVSASGLAAVAEELAARTVSLAARVADASAPELEAAALPPALRGLAQDAAALSDQVSRQCFTMLPVLRLVGITALEESAQIRLRGAA